MLKFLNIEKVLSFCKADRLLIGVILICLIGCKTDYEKLVDRELKRKDRLDSLFLGIRLGMSRADFYTHCWQLNKDQVVRQGNRNISVLYPLTELKDSADMNFYPAFENDSIYEMPVTVVYRGWASWNTQLSSDTLTLDLVRMLKKWYGGDFLKLHFKETGDLYVKVDGRRRIVVSKLGEGEVKMTFTDLVMEERKKNREKEEVKEKKNAE